MKGGSKLKPQAAVVTKSPLLFQGIERALSAAGFKTSHIFGSRKFVRNQRQRPYVVCFLDARLSDSLHTVNSCLKARPAERYVLVTSQYRLPEGFGELPARDVSVITECFDEGELLKLALRALSEEQKLEDGPPLEELLFERFCGYLQHAGTASAMNLYELVSERVDRPLLRAAMQWADGNQTRAAQVLGLHRNTLRTRLRALGLDKEFE